MSLIVDLDPFSAQGLLAVQDIRSGKMIAVEMYSLRGSLEGSAQFHSISVDRPQSHCACLSRGLWDTQHSAGARKEGMFQYL